MAMNVDLSNLSLDELKALQKDVAHAIKNYEQRKRKEALAAAEAAASELGFSLRELVGIGKAVSRSGGAARPAKYRHPENSSLTWSGRGRQPAWYKQAVEAGVSEDKMLIA